MRGAPARAGAVLPIADGAFGVCGMCPACALLYSQTYTDILKIWTVPVRIC
jgi:hypothetical protein